MRREVRELGWNGISHPSKPGKRFKPFFSGKYREQERWKINSWKLFLFLNKTRPGKFWSNFSFVIVVIFLKEYFYDMTLIILF